jgi:hypothetical protein
MYNARRNTQLTLRFFYPIMLDLNGQQNQLSVNILCIISPCIRNYDPNNL